MTKKELELKVRQLELELMWLKGQVDVLKQNHTYHPSAYPNSTPSINLPWTVTC